MSGNESFLVLCWLGGVLVLQLLIKYKLNIAKRSAPTSSQTRSGACNPACYIDKTTCIVPASKLSEYSIIEKIIDTLLTQTLGTMIVPFVVRVFSKAKREIYSI